MKRCPQCLFIYPETDTRCDFDNTALVAVDDAEIESAMSPAPDAVPAKKKRASKKRSSAESGKRPSEAEKRASDPEKSSAPKKRSSAGSKKSSRKKAGAITAAVALAFGLTGFAGYVVSQRGNEVADIPPVVHAPAVVAPLVVHASAPHVENAAPAPSPTAASKTAADDRTATSHSRTTAAPVSTSGPGMGTKLGSKPVILLTTGGKIDADEVWRTRDGVWYRRAGIVTLLKHNRVKAIINQ